ncbi:hypothetical protein [Mycobacterium sp.]|jgi:hypothetical protein|uniref:hypothetical protein n=1 Tax=Mycobacterium sp. TaxID=1785 RepID=UPI003F94CD5E
MTALDKDQESILAEPETIDEIASGETDLGSGVHPQSAADNGSASHLSVHAQSRAASALHELRRLEQRAIHLPIVGKLHPPDAHDVAYVTGLTALLAFGAVELPIALVVLGGHALVKQHHSRYLSAIGEVMEDVWGHQV